MCPSAPRVCSKPGGQKPGLSLSLDRIVGDDPPNIQEVTTGLALQTMDLDVHRRKWSLSIHGLKGESGEDEVTTDACVKLAKIILVSPTLPQPILWLVTASASRQAVAL